MTMFTVCAACSKEEPFTSLCSALSLIYFYFLGIFYIPVLITSIFWDSFVFSAVFIPSPPFVFFIWMSGTPLKGIFQLANIVRVLDGARCWQPPPGPKLPVRLLKRTDMTWLCCCTMKWGSSTLASVAISGGGWWESRAGRYFQTS